MEKFKERRHDRKESLNLIEYVLLNEEGDLVTRGMGRTRNVSEGGLLLETHRPLEIGTDVLVTLGLKDVMIQLRGRIVHINPPTEDKRHCSGIKFVVMGEKDKKILKKYIDAFNSRQGKQAA